MGVGVHCNHGKPPPNAQHIARHVSSWALASSQQKLVTSLDLTQPWLPEDGKKILEHPTTRNKSAAFPKHAPFVIYCYLGILHYEKPPCISGCFAECLLSSLGHRLFTCVGNLHQVNGHISMLLPVQSFRFQVISMLIIFGWRTLIFINPMFLPRVEVQLWVMTYGLQPPTDTQTFIPILFRPPTSHGNRICRTLELEKLICWTVEIPRFSTCKSSCIPQVSFATKIASGFPGCQLGFPTQISTPWFSPSVAGVPDWADIGSWPPKNPQETPGFRLKTISDHRLNWLISTSDYSDQ